ncbi:MAG: hypothetical protein QOJ41_1712, partial [Acidobacteriaceae bacterium]|nr:hypothetical protein [Acidobacteriaceae bacterium]
KNGQLVVERYNVRGQMDGWLKICKVQTTQNAKPGATPTRPSQPMNPPYLSEMPSVERVKSEIQGANPDDTLARQVAVFTYLPQIVHRSQGPNRSVREPLTADEQRVIGAYDLAAYEISQAYAKSHSPEEAKAFERKHGQYEMDAAFYQQWFNGLLSPAFRAGYQQVQKANSAHAQAHVDAERRQSEDARAQQAAPDSTANTGEVQPGSKAELRRCIASGRSQRNCFSEVLGNGFDQITGISLKIPSTPGLRMTGDYSSQTGFRLIFQPDKAAMSCRGVASPQPYAVEVSDTQALVKIQNGSKPVIFALRPDGKLEASGPIRITGQVPAGSRTEQTMGMTAQTITTQRELTPLEAQNYPDAKQNGQVFTNSETSTQMAYGPTGTRAVTQYVNKTVDCNLGLMTPTGPTPLPPDIESPFGLITTIFSGASVLMEGGNTHQALGEMLNLDKAPSPGLRMTGRYAGQQGFSVTFHPESATVACGDAARALEYSVQRNANHLLLKIRDDTNPITLQWKPDGSLFADGTVQVNGRVIVGTTEDPKNPFIFAPKIGRCAVGTLVAGGAPNPNGPTSATISGAPSTTANTAPAGATPSARNASLSIASGFANQPGVGNPLAGRPMSLMKDSFDNVLRKSGVQIPERTSAYHAFLAECQKGPNECKQLLSGIAAYSAANVKLDADGKATLPAVAAGTYYLFGSVQYNKQPLLFDLRIELKPGANSVTLGERNATPTN